MLRAVARLRVGAPFQVQVRPLCDPDRASVPLGRRTDSNASPLTVSWFVRVLYLPPHHRHSQAAMLGGHITKTIARLVASRRVAPRRCHNSPRRAQRKYTHARRMFCLCSPGARVALRPGSGPDLAPLRAPPALWPTSNPSEPIYCSPTSQMHPN